MSDAEVFYSNINILKYLWQKKFFTESVDIETLSERIAQLANCAQDIDVTVTFHLLQSSPSTPSPLSAAPDVSEESNDSIIFTKKTKKEGKQTLILQVLQKSVLGRKDKTRALVQELQSWQKNGYIDAHYNARVMYDELGKLIPLSFGYEVFKKHYNNTRF